MTYTSQQLDIDTLIAPIDLADVPLYIVRQSRIPDHLGGKSVCEGFTAPCLDLYLQPVIGSEWRGRGPCAVINDLELDGLDPIGAEVVIREVAIHELAHILERPRPYRDRTGVEPARIQFESLCLGEQIAREIPAIRARPPFEGHEAPFIRIALHLHHRALAAGHGLAAFDLCAGADYGLSRTNEYRAALGDEPRRMATASFREILSLPFPEAFSNLWAADMAHWQSLVS